MKTFSAILFLCALSAQAAFTEFYAISGVGKNTNSGVNENAGCIYSSQSGNYNASTHLFSPTDSSNPVTAGVTNGAFVCIYTNGNTNATYEAKVTGVVNDINGGITLSTIAFSGTEPATSSGNITLTFGGAWNGPTLIGDGFPFSFVSGAMTNDSGNVPRVNLKGTWYVTNPITDGNDNSAVWFQGYTNTAGDGNFCNIFGSNNIAGYVLLNVTGKNRSYANILFATNGNSGSSSQYLVNVTGTENFFYKDAFHDARCSGINMSSANTFHTCEAWNCDLANNASFGGFQSSAAGCIMINCFSHDHTAGANTAGFKTDGTQTSIGCIAANNSGDGFRGTGDVQLCLFRCMAFSNAGFGIHMIGASGGTSDNMCINFVNCDLTKNGKGGITNDTGAVSSYYNGTIMNCGFGTGTMTNANGGDIESKIQGVLILGKVAYPTDQFPYVSTNNFTVSATSAAKNAGTNTWLNVSPMNYTTTQGYLDIGAAQHLDSGGTTPGTIIFGN